MPYDMVTMFGKLQGAGAAAPVRAPTTFSSTSSAGYMHTSNNFVSTTVIPTRSGVGAYTVTFSDGLPVILDIDIRVASTTGAAAYKDAYWTDYNPTTRVLTFGTNLATTGAAVDLLSTDFVTFIITGQKTVPAY
jgi:hypothetical protein